MGSFAAVLLAATPLAAAPPPGVTAVAGAQVEIVRAERVSARTEPGGLFRKIRRAADGLIVDFE